jgi:serine/threonine protein kinase/Tfp pilus assembly protein PilF
MSANGASAPSGIEDGEGLDSDLAQALESYLAAVEAGRPVDLERLAAEHPAIAEQLRSCLGVLRLAGRVEGDAEAENSSDVGDGLAQPAQLGDFRLLRPVGRGGMGIVYEAEQLSLHRRVALKVLPFAAALDHDHLQRFKTESQAAAQLHHTNIVPVFSVGCERGVHYYAMQFIEGQTLAALIRDLRRLEGLEKSEPASRTVTELSLADEVVSGRLAPVPPRSPAPGAPPEAAADQPPAAPSSAPSTRSRAYFRTVAQLGIQAAEALDYAHRMGIVHRDIKPANLLVDIRGNLWITDFGLARMQSDSGLTLTGDVLGTLRYMSPEQALARRGVVDHRTDIYSLGVTLYELLALRPAFAGQDRQELLRQLTLEEPHSVRSFNPEVPADLETIILKAMNKEPESRYATAQELADDLRRFLEDKPIRAKRPTPWERAMKWSRRHQSLVIATVIGLMLAVIGLGIATSLIARERAEALHQRDEARSQRELALKQFALSRRAVDEMYTEFIEQWLAEQEKTDDVQRVFLLKALRSYQEFAQTDVPMDPPALGRLYRANAYRRVGDIELRLGRPDQAKTSYHQAIALLENLPSETRTVPEYRYQRAYSLNRLGMLLMNVDRLPEAERAFSEALAIWNDLVKDYPTRPIYRREQIRYHYVLGVLSHAIGRLAEAEAAFRQALDIGRKEGSGATGHAPSWAESPEVYARLGLQLHATGRLGEAEQAQRQALSLIARRQAQFPDVKAWRAVEAFSRKALGALLMQADRPGEAETEFQRCIAIEEASASGSATNSPSRKKSVGGRDCLERLRQSQGRPSQDIWREASLLVESLVSDLPDVSNRRQEVATSHNLMAWLFATDVDPNWRRDPNQAVFLARKAVDLDPESGEIWNTLGVAYCRVENWKAAIAALEMSMSLRNGGDSYDWFFLAISHWHLGHEDQARRWYEQALAWMDAHSPDEAQIRRFRAEAAALLGRTDGAVATKGAK